MSSACVDMIKMTTCFFILETFDFLLSDQNVSAELHFLFSFCMKQQDESI